MGMTKRRAVSLLVGVMDGLAHCHSRGVIHCDIKSDNVVLIVDKYPGYEVGDTSQPDWLRSTHYNRLIDFV